MPPIDVIRAALSSYKAWRWNRVVGPVVARFNRLAAKRTEASKRHRKVSDFDDSLIALKVRQLELEAAL